MVGRGRVSPNPLVGALVVQDGQVIGEGGHEGPGTDHAEVGALRAAGTGARGATLVCTLEPCSHHGRTPPCVDAVRAAGVARVVVGCLDPLERSRGQGVRILAEAGIDVAVADGPDELACRQMNGPFMTWSVTGRPEVTLKMAESLDGRVATSTGESQWISGEQSRARVHRWRADSDAVAVGIGTALADDPLLTARDVEGAFRAPLRLVFDSGARLPLDGKLASAGEGVLVIASANAPADRVRGLEASGVEVLALPGDARERLQEAVTELGRREVQSVLVEGGPTLAAGALEADVVDRVAWMVAPMLIGGDGAPALGGAGRARLADAWRLSSVEMARLGDDVLVTGRLREVPGSPSVEAGLG